MMEEDGRDLLKGSVPGFGWRNSEGV